MSTVQQKLIFFDPTFPQIYPELSPKPSDEQIKIMLANNNQNCPLSKVIVSEKNRGAMRILKRFAFNSFVDPFHSCKGMSFAIYSGPGQGKTYVVKQWAKTIGIPCLFVQSDALEDTWMLFELLRDMFEEAGTPLVSSNNEYVLPPCIIFFDEAHALRNELRTGGLLNAMEANDGFLRTKPPGKNQNLVTVNCNDVCWIAASTDPGMIYKKSEAFYDRFRIHIEWQPAGKKEISKIVKLDNERKMDETPGKYTFLSDEACEIVAKYETIPRKAIAFADQMIFESRMMGVSWKEAASTVAKDNGIDSFGMPVKIVKLLELLAENPISDKNIIKALGCRREQFDSQYAPYLITDIDDRGPLAKPTIKGWAITKAGCIELTKRNIIHHGEKNLAEMFK